MQDNIALIVDILEIYLSRPSVLHDSIRVAHLQVIERGAPNNSQDPKETFLYPRFLFLIVNSFRKCPKQSSSFQFERYDTLHRTPLAELSIFLAEPPPYGIITSKSSSLVRQLANLHTYRSSYHQPTDYISLLPSASLLFTDKAQISICIDQCTCLSI